MKTLIDDICGVVRLPYYAGRCYRLVVRDNVTGRMQFGKWQGTSLAMMDRRAQAWMTRFPTFDCWIEVELGNPYGGESDIRMVEVLR